MDVPANPPERPDPLPSELPSGPASTAGPGPRPTSPVGRTPATDREP